MQALVKGADGYDYVCDIVIGNMDFNVGDKVPEVYEDMAVFENVPAMIYPNGIYQAVIRTEES